MAERVNRFVLDDNPVQAAIYHCDKHVVKMILEEAQMLSTVHRKNGYDGDSLYKATHVNHPCTLWAGESVQNYNWGFELFVALLDEYAIRYDKEHKTGRLLAELECAPKSLPDIGLTPFPQAMPDDVKVAGDAVGAYRLYYLSYKNHIAEWRHSEQPDWWC